MSEVQPGDFIIPLSQCATVSQDETLYDAVVAMEATRLLYQRWDYRPRLILVHDEDIQIVGTVRHFELLEAMEPGYKQLGGLRALSGASAPKEFWDSVREKYGLWADPFPELCLNASKLKITEVMRKPSESEYMSKEASFGEVIHRMLAYNHPSLLVTESSQVIGVLRMSDIANHAINEMGRLREAKASG
ncbi:MAG: CBS domain-containing protein [Thermodesulfobacteriota bacterium]